MSGNNEEDSTDHVVDSMISQYYEHQRSEGSECVTGDGTWMSDHPIVALIEASVQEEAEAKAAAAFEHRDGKPDPLFATEPGDTYEVAPALGVKPDCLDQAWDTNEYGEVLSPGDWEQSEAALTGALSGVAEQGNLFGEYGGRISVTELKERLEADADLWAVLGVGLTPRGAGTDNSQYIGEEYVIPCPAGGDAQAECVNIVYDERDDDHLGLWDCNGCRDTHKGPHPEDVDRRTPLID